MKRTRVFAAALGVEINSFSPLVTDRAAFERLALYPAGKAPSEPGLVAAILPLARRLAAAGEIELTEGLIAGAQPGGPLRQDVYEGLRDELLDDLRRAAPVDIVLLGMHGAMSAQELEDCEGDLLARVRMQLGCTALEHHPENGRSPAVPRPVVAILLDSHGTLTPAMVAAADLIVCYKEYPHTDIAACAEKLLRLALATFRGEIQPVMRVRDCRQIAIYPTDRNPMRRFVDELAARERGAVLDISVFHGFPWSDVAANSTTVLVTTDNEGKLAERTASEYAAQLVAMRGRSAAPMEPLESVVARLKQARDCVLADTADNPGGGAPGDSTYVLRALLEGGVRGVAAGTLWDPTAVALAIAAGEGASLALRIGGKACSLSGQPMDLHVSVRGIRHAAWQPFGGGRWPMGDAVAVDVPALDWTLVLTNVRTQCFAIEAFTQFGVALDAYKVILVKSSQHFRASFGVLGREAWVVDAPGVLDHKISRLPYRHVRRPIWPFDETTDEAWPAQ